ncbi:Neurobeachin [Labeo rohita]|uniref:Neurobeachin n=1 Tax=Labeo rohita TaxID=84645 RepID=A0ABQ8L8N2_LABRO|nr:Neurobeachin [Labeo rohita]
MRRCVQTFGLYCTFINEGPLYSGLSPAFFPLLSGVKDDTPVLELKDCPDMDNELNQNEIDNINNLAINWDLPAVSNSNRRVIWPEPDSDEDEAPSNLEQSCVVTAFLREYIQTGSPAELCELLKFWTGWAVLPQHLYAEVSPDLSLPVVSTCLTTLKFPLRCRTFLTFTQAMRAAVSSTRFGFGLI